jgi:hypothetical protein
MVAASRTKPFLPDHSIAATFGTDRRHRFLIALRTTAATSKIIVARSRLTPPRPKHVMRLIEVVTLNLSHGRSLQGGSTGVSLSHRRLRMKADDQFNIGARIENSQLFEPIYKVADICLAVF